MNMNPNLTVARLALLVLVGLTIADSSAQAIQPTPQEIAEAKRLGVPDNELIGYVHSKRNPTSRVDLSRPFLSGPQLQAAIARSRSSADLCSQGGFELGSITGWVGAVGTYQAPGANSYGIPLLTMPGFTSGGFVTIVTSANSQHTVLPILNAAWNGAGLNAWNGPVDPTVASFGGTPAIPLPFPSGGSRWLRLGNRVNGFGAEGLQGSFVVTPTNAKFGFEYAIVAQEPQNLHPAGDRPQFIYQLQVGGVVVDSINRYPDQTDSFWNVGPMNPPGLTGGRVLWRRVSCHMKDLTPYIGQTATVTFINTDCSWGGHWGYTYLDRFCDPMLGKPVLEGLSNSYCEGDPILANGSKSSGVTQHAWTVTRLDAFGNPIASTTKSQTIAGALTAPVNIEAWYSSKGGLWGCGNKYRITLSINTECSANEKVSKDVYIECCQGCCTKNPVKLTEPYIKLKPSTAFPNGFDTALGMTWPGGRKRVEVNIINVLRKTMPNGAVHRSFGFVRGAAPSITGPAMTPVLPNLLFPWIARWESSVPVPSGANAIFPMTLQFSPPIANQTSFLRFTLMVRAFDEDCRACEVQQTFSFKFTGQGWEPIKDSEWPKNVIGDPTGVISGLTIGEIKESFGSAPKGAPRSGPGGAAKIDLSPFPPLDREMWPASVLNCCLTQLFRVSRTDPRAAQSSLLTGNWAFSPTITSSIAPAAKVEIAVMNAAAAAPMGQTYPTDVSLNNAQVVAAFAPPQYGALPFSHVVKWQSTGTSLAAGVNFPMMIQLPKPPANGTIYVHFTVRYTIFTPECRPCDTYQQHFLKIDAGKAPVNISPKDWPIKIDGPPDNGPGSPNKRGGGGAIRERR